MRGFSYNPAYRNWRHMGLRLVMQPIMLRVVVGHVVFIYSPHMWFKFWFGFEHHFSFFTFPQRFFLLSKMPPKTRTARASPQQLEILVDFVEANRNLIQGKLSQSFTFIHKEGLWKQLTQLLNSHGVRPEKTAEQWKRAWINLKCDAKKASALHSKEIAKTGGGPSTSVLSPIYERVARLIGEKSIHGEDLEETGRGTLPQEEMEVEVLLPDTLNDCIDDPSAELGASPRSAQSSPIEGSPLADAPVQTPSISLPSTSQRLHRRQHLDNVHIQQMLAQGDEQIEVQKQIALAMQRRNDIEEKRNDIFLSIRDSFEKFLSK